MINRHDISDFRLPPEWAPQSGIMLIWPHEHTDWAPYLQEIRQTLVEMARTITRHELLLLVAQNPQQAKQELFAHLDEEQQRRVIIQQADNNDTWARDTAPLTLISSRGVCQGHFHAHLLDFRFNGWGGKFAANLDDAINLKLYYDGAFCGVLENHSDFELEGGAIEIDDEGTLFTTSSVLLDAHRNGETTKEQVEDRLKRLIPNIGRVLWLDHGHLEGDDTDGHIDTLVRCAPNHTLLYTATTNSSDSHYEDLHAMEEELKAFRTRNGSPFHLLPLPLPDPIYDDGERLPATYANFLVLNGAVLVPTYKQPENDHKAMAAIASAFHSREIVGIDACTVIRQHGSLHCLSMQLPEGVINIRKQIVE